MRWMSKIIKYSDLTCYPLQIFPFDVEAVVPADVITLALDAEVQDRDDLDGFVAKGAEAHITLRINHLYNFL